MSIKTLLSKSAPMSVAGDSESQKFSLYVKIREIKQINGVLKQMSLMSDQEKNAWLEENGDIIQDSFDEMIDDSNSLFENLAMDDETLELSEKVVTSIRDTIYLFSSLTSKSDTIS